MLDSYQRGCEERPVAVKAVVRHVNERKAEPRGTGAKLKVKRYEQKSRGHE